MKPGTTIRIETQPNGAHDHLTGMRGTVAANQPVGSTGYVHVDLARIGTIRVSAARLVEISQ